MLKPIARDIGLLGCDGQTCSDILLLPYLEFLQEGPAPKGSYERDIEKLLNTKQKKEESA